MIKLLKQPFFTILSLLLLYSCGAKKTVIDRNNGIVLNTTTYFKTTNKKELKIDFYSSNTEKEKRPLLLYVHGGGFSGGARNENFIQQFALEMVKKGFAVASISYRLTMKAFGFGCNTKADLKIKAFNSASKDISLATNYIINHEDTFNIDQNKIILIGSSAGAEAILNLVYVYKNQILPKSFRYAGVIAMAGAITSLEHISNQNAIPTQLFHGVKDKLVPYKTAPHHYCTKKSKGYLILHGSKAIANKLKALELPYYLYTIEDGNHSWNAKPMYLKRKEILFFIEEMVLNGKKDAIEKTQKENSYSSKKP